MIIDLNETTLHLPSKYTWGDMKGLVATCADALRRQEVGKGDFMVCMASDESFESARMMLN